MRGYHISHTGRHYFNNMLYTRPVPPFRYVAAVRHCILVAVLQMIPHTMRLKTGIHSIHWSCSNLHHSFMKWRHPIISFIPLQDERRCFLGMQLMSAWKPVQRQLSFMNRWTMFQVIIYLDGKVTGSWPQCVHFVLANDDIWLKSWLTRHGQNTLRISEGLWTFHISTIRTNTASCTAHSSLWHGAPDAFK